MTDDGELFDGSQHDFGDWYRPRFVHRTGPQDPAEDEADLNAIGCIVGALYLIAFWAFAAWCAIKLAQWILR